MKDDLLIVVCAAGAVAMAGLVLLAYVQSRAALVVALALALAATLTVLTAILTMVGRDEPSSPAPESASVE
jgi:uncharacterized membrane protein YdfJ with MMPL/SSD domain